MFNMEKFFDKEGLIDTLHTMSPHKVKYQHHNTECDSHLITKQRLQYSLHSEKLMGQL